MRDSKLAGKLTLLVLVFAGLFIVFALTTWQTLDKVRVKGPIYNEVVLGKDLIADVLPPPAYIIESYLLTLQAVDETEPARVAQLIDRGDQLRLDFEARQEFWKRTLPQNEL